MAEPGEQDGLPPGESNGGTPGEGPGAADEATYLERLQEAVEAALDVSTSSHVGW